MVKETFGPLHQDVVATVFRDCTGRMPTTEEFDWLKTNSNCESPTSGWFGIAPDWTPGKKLFVIYCACHSIPMIIFWKRWSHLLSQYNWIAVFGYQLKAGLPDALGSMFLNMFERADVVVYTPMFRNQEFDPFTLRKKYERPGHFWVGFHSPSFEALWPICLGFGDEHIRELLRAGVSRDEIKRRISACTLDCHLPQRFTESVVRLRAKDDEVEIGFADFFLRRYKNHRMFFTHNHPSFSLVAYLCMRIEKSIAGVPTELTPLEENFCLHGLPLNPSEMLPLLPDHPIVRNELGIAFADSIQSPQFYERLVDQVVL